MTATARSESSTSPELDMFAPLFQPLATPLGFEAGDENLYRYVGNGPVNKTDPSGLQPPQAPIVALGGGVITSEDVNYQPTAWPNIGFTGPDWSYHARGPTLPEDVSTETGLRIGIGKWTFEEFVRYSKVKPEEISYGCGGIMALRAGLPIHYPHKILQVEGGRAFGSLAKALDYLHGPLSGNGLLVAVQKKFTPYESADGKPIGAAFEGNISQLSRSGFQGTNNFCTLQSNPSPRLWGRPNWYWEDANTSLANGGRIRHYIGDEQRLHRNFPYVMYIVVPNAPTRSPNPPELHPPVQTSLHE